MKRYSTMQKCVIKYTKLWSAGTFTNQQQQYVTVKCPLSEDNFFNRDREKHLITDYLKGEPRIYLFTGPRNCGKTTLLLRCLEDLKVNEQPVNVCHLDLRKFAFETEAEFKERVLEKLLTWEDSVLDAFRKVSASVNLEKLGVPATINLNQTPSLAEKNAGVKLNILLEKISVALPNYSFMRGKLPTPVLFIDECQELNRILEDNAQKQSETLNILLRWLVTSTKTDSKFHVILATTDSFYYLWLRRKLSSDVFTTFVVGFLTMEEAEKYWKKRLEDLPLATRQMVQQCVVFKDLYEVCGGNIYHIRLFLQDLVVTPVETPSTFSKVESSRDKLESALRCNGINAFGKDAPKWKHDDVVTMMKMLTSSKNGYVSYREFSDKLGEGKVDSLISHSLLHLRPTNKGSYDIPDSPNFPIITAESPCELFAMKQLLKERQLI